MQELALILFLVVLAVAITWLVAYVALLVNGLLIFFRLLPEWTWTVVLLILTLATVRGLRYSPD
ncbi:hypothetical protein NG798_07000 [Ancylothrix sp. C2]|uniref:hypothetical protein n=1 Tax=Ancylothrix sp. D3o TaxID=2953691 RepID=UPI0021BA5798|nr:hypothetical protein [Ancylothrix sp. D3o]MCT7949528.1 hypothetical protein [Ancylothrix sp. D3o]